MEITEPKINLLTTVEREEALKDLYVRAFPAVARFVHKMGGTLPEAKDIFQDALILFYEKQVAAQLTVKTSEMGYVLGIAKHLWLGKHRQDQGRIPLDEMEQQISLPEDLFLQDEEVNRLLMVLRLTGQKCLQLLQAFYYEGLGLKDIAEVFGFSTVRSATVQKYKCLEKVREEVKNRSLTYDDLA